MDRKDREVRKAVLRGPEVALGLESGRNDPNTSVDDNYRQTRRFLSDFTKLHGSTNCQELTGINLGTEGGQKQYKAENKYPFCEQLVQDATRIAVSIIEDGQVDK